MSSISQQQHKYPSSMAHLPIDLSTQQSEKLATLQQKFDQTQQQVEQLKRRRQRLLQRKATLQVMNTIMQPRAMTFLNKKRKNLSPHLLSLDDLVVDTFPAEASSNDLPLDRLGGVQKLQQQMHILKEDYEQCKMRHAELKEANEQAQELVTQAEQKLKLYQQVQNSVHDQLEQTYIQSKSIDDLNQRFKGLSQNEQCLMMNIGATHETLFHGLLHLFENNVCFESIVLNPTFLIVPQQEKPLPSQQEKTLPLQQEKTLSSSQTSQQEKQQHTLVIKATDIETISKHEKRGGIVIKSKSQITHEFFGIKKLDEVFECLFHIKSGRKFA